MVDVSSNIREAQARGRQQSADLAASARLLSAAASSPGLTFVSGQRVLDLATGIEGSIVKGTAQHVVASTPGTTARQESYAVALVNGVTVARDAEQLAAIPQSLRSSLVLQSATPKVSAGGFTGAPANAQLNPNPISQGGAAGPNAAAVIATEQSVGSLTTAQQLALGNPGVPPPGSLEYADWKRRGLL